METTIEGKITDHWMFEEPGGWIKDYANEVDFDESTKVMLVDYSKQLNVNDDESDEVVDKKAHEHQVRAQALFQSMIDGGLYDAAELVFNVHRVLTGFRGYGANDAPSSDVEACFGDGFEIPEEGVIVVDRFVTRNLPKIVEILEARGVDLSRLRVRCPSLLLAAQLYDMNEEKKAEFVEVVSKLNADQFLIEDEGSCHDISLSEGEDIAVHFTPRTLPFRLSWGADPEDMKDPDSIAVHFTPRTSPFKLSEGADTEDMNGPDSIGLAEEETAESYRFWVREEVKRLVPGGRVFANIVKIPEFGELRATIEDPAKPGGRRLAKPTQQVSKNVSDAILACLHDELGMEDLIRGPRDDSPPEDYDHTKPLVEVHSRKPKVVEGDWHNDIAGDPDGPRF